MKHYGDITKIRGYKVPMKKVELLDSQYFVDEKGNVLNKYGKKVFQYTDKDGYKYIVLRRKGKRKKFLIHRLVAKSYLDNPLGHPQVNHIDGNKTNNDVSNLEWVSPGENQLHSRYVLNNVTGFADTPVMCLETGKVYRSTRDAWRDTGVGYSHISECAKGKRKTAGRFHWRYV